MEKYQKELDAFFAQMKEWEIAMPDVKPLVSDFDLNEFPKTGLIEMWIANEFKGGYCGKYLYVTENQWCPSHHHKGKLETFFIVRGDVEMIYDGQASVMKPGDVKLVEVGHNHAFRGLGGPALILEVSMTCKDDDDYFEDPRIPQGGDFVAVPKK